MQDLEYFRIVKSENISKSCIVIILTLCYANNNSILSPVYTTIKINFRSPAISKTVVVYDKRRTLGYYQLETEQKFLCISVFRFLKRSVVAVET